MGFDISDWVDLKFEDTSVYVHPENPDWFVPNTSGREILDKLAEGAKPEQLPLQAQRFLARLPDNLNRDYRGRDDHLSTDHLSELWLHVTDRCNMACRHCLFSYQPQTGAELPVQRILDVSRQAWDLGCRVFALTGGEPFVHCNFREIVDGLAAMPETNVVILTNGMLLDENADNLKRWSGRVHLQVSLDGLEKNHDSIRGRGQYRRLMEQLARTGRNGIPFTLSTCVMKNNVAEMPDLVDLAAEMGASNVHFMWYFIRGRGDRRLWAEPDTIFDYLRQASLRAEDRGVTVDNIEALKTQIFAPQGTRYDGSGAGWDSLAYAPDGKIYPSAALVGIDKLATEMDCELADAWRNSEVLQNIRRQTVAETHSPLRYLLGGGDTDHSYVNSGEFIGRDPYMPLYDKTALWLIVRRAEETKEINQPGLRLKMGDVLESCGPHGAVAATHSNCLLAVAEVDGHTSVREFYTTALQNPREDICNPVFFPDELIDHIPEHLLVRGYGCGSPVIEADLRPGQKVADLGSGTGVECLIASRLVGPKGKVIGVDMLDVMLNFATEGAKQVAERLGYANVEFRKGYLEDLPLDDGWADVIISNCVVNLATDKRKVFGEIRRALAGGGRPDGRPPGRCVISDVVCIDEPDPAVRNDETMRGQCIAGALTTRDLFGLLAESGLAAARVIKWFPYRVVGGHRFYSMTFEAVAPAAEDKTIAAMYRGPAAASVTFSGVVMPAGQVRSIPAGDLDPGGEEIFVLDDSGRVANAEVAPCCSCAAPPEQQSSSPHANASSCCAPSETDCHADQSHAQRRSMSDCMICGADIEYLPQDREFRCEFCGRSMQTSTICVNGHFICDKCHLGSGPEIIERICTATDETDMIALMQSIRRHQAIPMHGPEHHAMVPGVILACYRNLGGQISDEQLRTGIRLGAEMAGGSCAFMGICGAAVGVGVAYSVILESNPYKGVERKAVQSAVNAALSDIAAFEAPRCCQRDCYLALKSASKISTKYLGMNIPAEKKLVCAQIPQNAECVGNKCPLYARTRSSVEERARLH